MHHNILGYWRHLQNLPAGDPDLPAPRVCRLMLEMFEGWRTRQPFPERDCFGHVRDRLGEDIMAEPLAVRRGYAMRETLRMIAGEWGRKGGFFTIRPDEMVVGTMPPFSVGQGKEVMDYLKGPDDDHDERLEFEIGFLNPWSNFGHVCPNHEKVVNEGLLPIVADCQKRRAAAESSEEVAFYQSIEIALAGVIEFAHAHAAEAERHVRRCEAELGTSGGHLRTGILQERVFGMREVAERLRRIPAEPCESFADAVQCVFLLNCVLHWTGELTSLGRLDQILAPFLEDDGLSDEEAQEIIDCLWVKLDERVLLDRRHIDDHFTSADGALMGVGGPSNFDQGALTNQWMQQVTIGGVLPTGDDVQQDACNRVTRLCLHAARRLPFNCPTLDLRVHADTPDDVIDLATRALLSGGAHPVLLNDDKIIPALERSHPEVALESARNYACDGCYETLFPGETEFSFFYVPGIDALEKALNGGAGFGMSGTTYLRGMKGGFRTPDAADIGDIETLYAVFEQHIALNAHRQIAGLLRAYGAKGGVCPSPILSAMIGGCVASGRDFYDGGARYHVFAPLMTGISTVADSLHVIDRLVFGERAFSLEELVSCLRSNWGTREVTIGLTLEAERIGEIRERCIAQPKFGHGRTEVDRMAWRVIDSFVDATEAALANPLHEEALTSLRDRFGSAEHPFIMAITPGVGTFEQYAFGGSFAGATPDGRMSGQPIASDLAASPVPQDREPLAQGDEETADGRLEHVRESPLAAALASWNNASVNRLSDGAPSDLNIREDFPPDQLADVIRAFADGDGSNIMTITVSDPETMRAAEARPLDHDLLRVRMGGWTEFFSVLFPEHKKQHRRRPLYTAKGAS